MVDFRLELVQVPVSDVDRAKAFYTDKAGFVADHDHTVSDEVRFVQLTPPGSACDTAEEAEAQTRATRRDGGAPWSGYDNQEVHEINKRLTNADPALARRVRDYEWRNKKRSMVLGRTREKAA